MNYVILWMAGFFVSMIVFANWKKLKWIEDESARAMTALFLSFIWPLPFFLAFAFWFGYNVARTVKRRPKWKEIENEYLYRSSSED